MNIPDAPDIARTMATGYPKAVTPFIRVCPECEEDMTEEVYEVEGREICECCFKNHVRHLLDVSPKEVASYMDIFHRSIEEYGSSF